MAPSTILPICNLNDSVYLPIHATEKPNSFLESWMYSRASDPIETQCLHMILVNCMTHHPSSSDMSYEYHVQFNVKEDRYFQPHLCVIYEPCKDTPLILLSHIIICITYIVYNMTGYLFE